MKKMKSEILSLAWDLKVICHSEDARRLKNPAEIGIPFQALRFAQGDTLSFGINV
jgi:hypothetical protein